MKIKRLTETAQIPKRSSEGAAGFDLFADFVEGEFTKTEDGKVIAASGKNLKIHTGVSMAIPHGYVGLVFARSGLACKQGLRPANCVGVIDEDYRGEIIVNLYNDINIEHILDNLSEGDAKKMLPLEDVIKAIHEDFAEITIGDKVAQIVFVQYLAEDFEEVDELDETERGEGGFGSTGTK